MCVDIAQIERWYDGSAWSWLNAVRKGEATFVYVQEKAMKRLDKVLSRREMS